MDEIDYGERVAQLRAQTGLSQEEFADTYDIPLRTLQDIEGGKVRRPQRKTRDQIAAAKVKIEGIFGMSTSEATRSEWPPDVRAFLNALGRFLVVAMTEEERDAWIMRETRRIFEEFGEQDET